MVLESGSCSVSMRKRLKLNEMEKNGEKWRIREKVEEKEGWRKDHLQVPTGYFPVRKDTEDGLR